jgi:hypothetical protein
MPQRFQRDATRDKKAVSASCRRVEGSVGSQPTILKWSLDMLGERHRQNGCAPEFVMKAAGADNAQQHQRNQPIRIGVGARQGLRALPSS